VSSPLSGDGTAGSQSHAASANQFLTDKEASRYLWERYRIRRSPRRLGQLRAMSSRGPQYHRDGNAVRYRRDALDDWALKQLGEPAVSTSEETARRARP
jgi:hypothetical protein